LATDRQTDKQTDKQMDSTNVLSCSHYCERRINNTDWRLLGSIFSRHIAVNCKYWAQKHRNIHQTSLSAGTALLFCGPLWYN